MRNRWLKRNRSPGGASNRTRGNGRLIDLRDVVKTYETGAGELTVLQDVTLQVQAGEFVSVVVLERVGIAEQVHKLPSALSGGEQQRAAIARALANDPSLVVADEPTGNLDTATAGEVFALFEGLVDQGKTLLVVTHDRELSSRTQRVLHLLDGRIHRDQNNGKFVR